LRMGAVVARAAGLRAGMPAIIREARRNPHAQCAV
jgi:hypothetical protein